MENQIHIALADHNQLFREGLVQIIQSQDNFNVVIETDNGETLLEKIGQQVSLPDIVLLDLNMPRIDGIEAAQQIRKKHPSVKMIVLTKRHEENFIIHMLNLGVNAYLFKNTSSEEVKKAIQAVYERDFYFDDHISQTMLRGLRQKQTKKSKNFEKSITLTPREIEVLKLICEENTTAEIAEKLYVSKRTIETHRKNLLEKLHVKNTVGLVIKAIQHQLVQLKSFM